MLRKMMMAGACVLLAATPVALADEQADATAQCVVVAKAGAVSDGMVPEQKAQLETLITSLCGCITTKVATLGDDGQKVLHVLAKTTVEQATASGGDPNADKKNAVAILMADYGMSEADATALYERVDPQVKKFSEECQAEAMKSVAPPATP